MTKPKNTGELLKAIEALIQKFNLENYHAAVRFGISGLSCDELTDPGMPGLTDYMEDYLRRRKLCAIQIMELCEEK